MKKKTGTNHTVEMKSNGRVRAGVAEREELIGRPLTRRPARIPNPEGPLPPLPEPIPESPFQLPDNLQPLHLERARLPELEVALRRFRSLRHGCYLIRYTPSRSLTHYDGTMRIERHGTALFGGGVTASGDLYRHRRFPIATTFNRTTLATSASVRTGLAAANTVMLPLLRTEPNPANGIPIFPRGDYRYYLRVTRILEQYTTSNSFTLGFERWRFNGVVRPAGTPLWTNDGTFSASMEWKPAPSGYPSSGNYLEGDVKDSSGNIVGQLTMGWVSAYLRKATIEIDTVSNSETPLNSGEGHTWRSIFDEISWDITVDESDHNVTEPSGEFWSDSEMHAAMLSRRDSSNLDGEWRYHLICVRRLDSTTRGIMYDNGATDSNDVPREGAGISSHWTIPNADPWGHVKGQRFGTATAAYFRTALHEIGHAMGLYHNTIDMGIMNTTPDIAASAVAPQQFPDNVKWAHASNDQQRLKHMPDIWVRPGGIPFGESYSTTPISSDDVREELPGLQVRVTPLLDAVPLGAPVRVKVELVNTGEEAIAVPRDISLRSHSVRGKVLDSGSTVRTFCPLIVCVDDEEMRMLEPGEGVSASMTLLRGAQGALFPSAGPYTVSVEIDWEFGGIPMGATGEGTVMVTPVQNDEHAAAALKVLSTPNALLTLVIGGDHITDGNEAIQAALANDVLRPHYAAIEAKRLARGHGKRKPDMSGAASLLTDDAVMSEDEVASVARICGKGCSSADASNRKKIGKVLQEKADDLEARDEVQSVVASMA
ncbi:MAG: hypothetical protein AB7G11_11530 [Phycisphaerales bacterium]